MSWFGRGHAWPSGATKDEMDIDEWLSDADEGGDDMEHIGSIWDVYPEGISRQGHKTCTGEVLLLPLLAPPAPLVLLSSRVYNLPLPLMLKLAICDPKRAP